MSNKENQNETPDLSELMREWVEMYEFLKENGGLKD